MSRSARSGRGRHLRRLACVGLVGLLGCASLSVEDLARILTPTGSLDESTVSAGLREALAIGTERAATSLGQEGGFSSNPALRLGLPDDFDAVIGVLRTFGQGDRIDAIETAMNRGAERAVAAAVPIFAEAIQAMTIADAFAILRGPPDAATRYFEERTTAALTARFEPSVRGALEQVGFYASYNEVAGIYRSLPLPNKPILPSLEAYVTERTLRGLFSTLAEEEARIREEPVARTSALLRRVFGETVAGPSGGP